VPKITVLPHMSLRDLIERIEEADDLATHELIAARLRVHVNTFYNWRAEKRLPNDKAMLSLSEMAGIDATEGLLLLNVWRSTGRVKAVYMRALHQLGYHYILRAARDVVETGIVAPAVTEKPRTSTEQIRT
jgi:hypothetical protein